MGSNCGRQTGWMNSLPVAAVPDYAEFEALRIVREDRLLTVRIGRPEDGVLTTKMRDELAALWPLVAADDSVGAVILTGSGPAFCSGGDVRGMRARLEAGGPQGVRSTVRGKRFLQNMLEVEQPIIAAVNGDAVTIGASIAFACDFVVAGASTRFMDLHTRLGLAAGDGGVVCWPLMMSIHKAKEYLLTGDPLPATEAERLSWINAIVPDEELLPRARELARRLAYGPSWAIRWTKTSLNKILRQRLNQLLDTAQAVEWLTMGSDEQREATAAYLEGRPTTFQGR